MTLQEAEMLTRAAQARTNLLLRLAQVLAARRMEWWVGTLVAQWLRGLAQRSCGKLPRE